MILNLGSLAFNANLVGEGGNPAWGTELGQGEGYKFVFEDMSDFFTGLVYSSIPDIDEVYCPLGKGGNQRADYDFVIASLFDKVFVNGKRVQGARFILLIVKKIKGDHHVGRRTIKYNPRMTYHGDTINDDCYHKIVKTMRWADDAAWFIHEINIKNQDELHFTAYLLEEAPALYNTTEARRNAFLSRLPKEGNYNLYGTSAPLNEPNQIIFYGAPGTGKSHKVLKATSNLPVENVFRTTFHPDSDYATFVGCYKPTKVRKPVRDMAGNIALDKNKNEIYEESITYQFVPQAFTKAYIRAWQTKEPVFLVIEEINRGNCAQIFGDLFQLLDRDNGASKYPIKPDTDLGTFIHTAFQKDGCIANESTAVFKGEELILPANLYIWATMNTSDQSLFPIDSAFKRRWDWEYVPIENHPDENYMIHVNGTTYDWWEFVNAINKEVFELTHSEDKQLGYFFVRPQNGIVDTNMLVNKVFFYLWNDVFKDYDIESQKAFKKPNSTDAIAFKDFFVGGLNEELAEQVLINLNVQEEIAEAAE